MEFEDYNGMKLFLNGVCVFFLWLSESLGYNW